MVFYCGTMRKQKKFNTLQSLIIRKVFADEKKTDEKEQPPAGDKETEKNVLPSINYEDLIARARKEEKDKLYTKIKALEEKLTAQTNTINAHLLTIGTKDIEISDLKTKIQSVNSDDSEVVKVLKGQISSLDTELSSLKSKQPNEIDEDALRASIREEVEQEFNIKLYRIEKLQEAGDDILTPELVIGTTNEEVDRSIEVQKTKTLEIKKKLGIVDEDGNSLNILPKKPKATPNNPPKDKGQKKVDLEYLAELDPASPEYAEARKKLGLR